MITHLSAFWGDFLWKQGSNLQLSHLDVTDLQTRTENVCLCACVGVCERERSVSFLSVCLLRTDVYVYNTLFLFEMNR